MGAGGTDLPPALCRGLVDGDPLGRVRAEPGTEAGGTPGLCALRGLRDRARSGEPAGPAPAGAAVALHGGAAPGRGDAPADHCRGGSVRRGTAKPERRAPAPGGAVEIRLQEHQVHRPHHPDRGRASDRLESGAAEGVWLLQQRESRGRAPALVAAHRAPDRRVPPPSHRDVQRLRRPGGGAVCGHGPEEVLSDRKLRGGIRCHFQRAWCACRRGEGPFVCPVEWAGRYGTCIIRTGSRTGPRARTGPIAAGAAQEAVGR
jgi:hypothetical protein